MKILSTTSLAIPDIKVIKFSRFADHRGYFTEHFRRSDFDKLDFMKDVKFTQSNESFSKNYTVRGLHFQWNPYMGKLVRTIQGRMLDIVLDIRKGSPTFGKAIIYDMPSHFAFTHQDWIWVPPGFAHGNTFTEDTTIEYFCSGEYSQGCEAGISPLAEDIDWSLADKELLRIFQSVAIDTPLITAKDKNGFTLTNWVKDERSNNFVYE